jgi:glycosyltransferase involved in cell wall biosynthesis
VTGSHPTGVNVLGYHHVTSGLGEAARQITTSLHAAGVETRTIDVIHTGSPRRRDPEPVPDELFAHTIAVVTASELPAVWASLPTLRAATKFLVGYWFWELAAAPSTHRVAIDLVDEIWAPTRFIRDAYTGSGTPVRLTPLYLAEPSTTDDDVRRWRQVLGTESFHFVTSLDLLSIIHRKNPIGTIEAFVRAFAGEPDAAVRLTLKILNGDERPTDLETIVDAAEADTRISVLSEHLDAVDHTSLIAAADCFVSLHRSEGLGLQLADAMWLGTPVLATRYGGNVDFMDDSCAALVDAELIPVGDGRGAYPDDAVWAAPDLGAAARWMRRVANDEATRSQLSSRARTRMSGQASKAEFGSSYACAFGAS